MTPGQQDHHAEDMYAHLDFDLKLYVSSGCSVSWSSQFVGAACNGSNVSALTELLLMLASVARHTDRTDITQLS